MPPIPVAVGHVSPGHACRHGEVVFLTKILVGGLFLIISLGK
jgi:hypothetical protein